VRLNISFAKDINQIIAKIISKETWIINTRTSDLPPRYFAS